MKKYLKVISQLVIIIALPLVLLFTSVEVATFDKGFYKAEYEKYDVVGRTGIKILHLMDITGEMLEYLKGDREDLEIYHEVHGEKQLIFDERDQRHMVDVQILFLKGFLLRNILLILLAMAIGYLFWAKEKRKIFKGVFLSSIISFGIILLLGIIISTDFNKYFNLFHYIFFDNDLWRLDPKKSILINLVPLEFFMDIVKKIALYFFSSMGLFTLFSGIYLKKKQFIRTGGIK